MPKFLHAADLHIDSPLRGLEKYEGAPAEKIRAATREAFDDLIELAIQEEVRFVILAGDVFDRDPPIATSLYFNSALQRLSEAEIPVFIARGNHDHAGIVTPGHTLVRGVHVFDHREAETFDELPDVAIHGRSYPSYAVHDDLSLSYPEPVHGKLNIGVLHTSLGGYAEHAPYAPTTPATLASRGYDYWALGHVHRFERIDHGRATIVFPGNLQGRHARETGPKGAAIVEYEGSRILSVEHRALDVVRWHRLELKIDESDDVAMIREAVQQIERASADDRENERLAIFRLSLRTHRELGFDLRARIIESLTHLSDEVWIEKVELRRAPDHLASNEFLNGLGELADELLSDVDALEELRRTIDETLTRAIAGGDRQLIPDTKRRIFGEDAESASGSADRDALEALFASALERIATTTKGGTR